MPLPLSIPPWTPFLVRLLLRTLILIRQPLRHAANRPVRIEVFPNHAVFIQGPANLLRRTANGT